MDFFKMNEQRCRYFCSFNSFRHYRRALGALLVYDVTKEASFQSLKSWLENLKQNAESDIVIMLVGNKSDIVKTEGEDAREVPTEAARHFAQHENLLFIETSAKSNANVRDAFENLLQEIYNQR
jgi:Rab family protein